MKKTIFLSAIAGVLFWGYIRFFLKLYEIFEIEKYLNKDIFSTGVKIIGICFLLLCFKKIKILMNFHPKYFVYLFPILLIDYFCFTDIVNFFSGDKNDFKSHDIKIITYFINAIVEEVLFRGIVLSLFIKHFVDSNKKHFILYSSFASSLLFGLFHTMNFFTNEFEMSGKAIVYQVYAAFSIGFLLSIIYLKTRNLLYIILSHFIYNFYIYLQNIDKHTEVQSSQKSATIISILISLIYFGLPLFVSMIYFYFFVNNDENLKKILRQV
ncbi:CPBP family intramembrane metalloprotease [Chryseobacterium sp. GMJ5]|uniref:CPBP family intramembrane metalloprotease n=1 Tax=Chryseobacterium gilvum TaxID=2976534 RepID=A0ABT2VYA3_9FLAO|nr:CPBP family intramembrane glutamic endopeptidase [Chryseobacterium gilvum]MCU7614980.1 CPBP family intramembrane metalloprotease [Chryseobacterium gilvum]